MGRKAAQKVRHHPRPGAVAAQTAGAAGARRERPSPLRASPPAGAAPEPPPAGALPRAPGSVPPVIDRVPTEDKVVFLTFDDGAEKDPRFVDMVREPRLPISMFLADSAARSGYDHFGQLRRLGACRTTPSRTPSCPVSATSTSTPRSAGQQDRLKGRFGTTPRLFRPPYGSYDGTHTAGGRRVRHRRDRAVARLDADQRPATRRAPGCAPVTSSWPTSAARPS
ncbi:polysaccharide deacetylase family protein [Streptomyces sp. KL116D]|uniref:polysaccharide deacetylase family protein n=1 Tax=Streptomyces sp. KL116D TaxID=3045152 RepID=UPI003557D0E6